VPLFPHESFPVSVPAPQPAHNAYKFLALPFAGGVQ